jgi:1-acyl-sn-glycerol-3-phosphate acyltransferase
MLMMDRSDIRQSLRIINQASELINTSQSIGVMPTGTRSFEELEFNNGTFKIALKAKCDILPITLMNTGEIFERNKKIKKAKTIMYVHPLLKYEEFKDMDTIEIAKKVENIIYGAKNKKEI